jgi:N-acetylneuraminic acid mutarotase
MKISKNLLFLAMLSLFSCSLFISCEPNPGDDTIGNWINWSDFPGKARSAAVAFSIGNRGYVGTGQYKSSNYLLSDFYAFNPDNGSWTQVAGLPDSAQRFDAVAFTINNKAYVGLGKNVQDYKKDFWVYDPETNVWTPLKPLNTDEEDHAGPSARVGAVAFTIGNIGYVGTGFDGADLLDIWAFDPGTNTWSRKANFHNTVREAVAFVIDGEGYIVTGLHSSVANEFFYKYDPSTDAWTALHPIYNTDNETFDDDYEIKRSAAVGFVVNNKAYVATGSYGQSPRSDVWEYNPRTDRWIKKTSMEGDNPSREDAVAFVLANGRAFVATGLSSSSYCQDTWEFQPMADYNDSSTE